MNEEEGSMDSTDGNDTRLSDLHNTTIKTEEESDEDLPLVRHIYITVLLYYKKFVMHHTYSIELKICSPREH